MEGSHQITMLYPVRTGGECNQMEIGYLDDHGRIQFRIEAGNACGHYDGIAAVIRNGKIEIPHNDGKRPYRIKADYARGPMFGHFIGAVESADEGEGSGVASLHFTSHHALHSTQLKTT